MSFKYDVDVVLCIDATRSMEPVIKQVKEKAQKLPEKILRSLHEKGKTIGELRLRIILFRDYLYSGEHAMEASDFIRYPEQQGVFNRLIESIELDHGGDEPEDGLEALAYAMSSDWQKAEPGKRRRQIIVVLTDAPTHPLGYAKDSPYYDSKMPNRFETLSAWWGDGPEDTDAKMDYFPKRLLLFAPKADWWTTIANEWENVIFVPTVAGQSMKERHYEEIIDLLTDL